MAITLDPFQSIVAFSWASLKADIVILYARLVPPHTTLMGYGHIIIPFLAPIVNFESVNSVGNWPSGPSPFGSGNYSYPENGNGQGSATRLPTFQELDQVYIWHCGRTVTWGLADQLIMNVRKFRTDYPDMEVFQIQLASHAAFSGQLPPNPPDSYNPPPSPSPNLSHYVGIRAYKLAKFSNEGSFDFGPVTKTVDPFGNVVHSGEAAQILSQVARFSGEFLTAYENLSTGSIELYNGSVVDVEASGWNINVNNIKKSRMFGGHIQVGFN